MRVKLKIKTYCKTIYLQLYKRIKFDYDRCKISLTDIQDREELYFGTIDEAREVYLEIIDAIREEKEEIDLTRYIIVYGTLTIEKAQQVLKETSHEE